MNTRPALLLLVAFGACFPTQPERPPEAVRTSLLVRANVSGTAIATVVVEITAADIVAPLTFNIPVVGGLAAGTVTAPAGSNRLVTMRAFDAGGIETDSGSVTLTIQPGANPTIVIVLEPLVGSVPVEATLGSFLLVVAPSAEALIPGDTVTLTATIQDAGGAPVTGQVVWGSLSPGIATVVATGPQTARVTAVTPGHTTVAGTFSGTAATVDVVVTAAPQGAWTHEPPGLTGIADAAGHADHDFVLEDVDGTEATSSGWYNPYPGDFADGQLALITDSTAPFPDNVVQITYPIGWDIGAAPGEVDRNHPLVTEFYLGFYFKISDPYQGVGGGHNKIAYIYTPTRDLVLEFFPNGDRWNLFMAEYVSDSSGVEVDHVGSFPMVGGAWYKIELSMSYSRSRIQWWVNGVFDKDFACDFTAHAGGGLGLLQFSPTYGGGGLPAKTEVDYLWYDHVRLSGSP